MRRSAHRTGIWLVIFVGVVLSLARLASADALHELKNAPQAKPKATTPVAKPSEAVKPMKVGGEVSAPKPITRLNIRWPDNPTQCYQLGVAVFQGVVDRNGTVHDVKLLKGPDNEFTKAAREAIEHQKWQPAIYRGRPVDVTYHVSVNHVPVKKVKGPC
jgi:hypothetical protein